jgi:hypothetical protein
MAIRNRSFLRQLASVLSRRCAVFLALAAPLAVSLPAAPLACDMNGYKALDGLEAKLEADILAVTWRGERETTLRATFGIDDSQPVVRSLEVRKAGGEWAALGSNLSPEFRVSTGKRRISNQQLNPVRDLGHEVTPELIEREKWNVFWDAPMVVPGVDRINVDMPRSEDEIRRANSSFNITGCALKTDGVRLEISFPGLTLGIFSGRLQYTVYRGTNLVRMEAIVKTDEPSVAYKYDAGLKGFSTQTAQRVIWRDVARAWQKYEFGGAPNDDPVGLRARNRLAIVESANGSVAVFPAPHKFFFAREIEMNLGYVWYRKDNEESFSVGVRQAEREEMYRPYGVSDDVWSRRSGQSRQFAVGNFALFNAPPGTWQRMASYFYLSPHDGRATQEAVLAFTHGDRYKPLPGHQVAISHFHTHFAEEVTDAGSLDVQPPWIPAFRALGINIAMMSDFHGDGHPSDPGPLRFPEQHDYFEACRRHSDRDFLLMPGEEPNAHFGGHYTTVFPRPVYWSKVRPEGKPLVEEHPQYGRVYYTGSAADELEVLKREGGLIWQSHPRTKGSTGYPDQTRETEYFLSDRFLGGAYQSLPADLSQPRICEERCFGVLDDMNNWAAPKYLFAEGDTYSKFPEDEIYPHLIVNYVKVNQLPRFDQDWTPITQAIRAGDFFVTTGEILIDEFQIVGSGENRQVEVQFEWTFPLEFVEVVWGDGDSTKRRVEPATSLGPFGKQRFRIPFETKGTKWVRFAVWDSAGNGAFTQPLVVQ